MEKVCLLFFAILINAGIYAQSGSPSKEMNPAQPDNIASAENTSLPDGYLKKDGKMIIVENGKSGLMEKDITLANGTVIMSTGSYTKKDGENILFKDGEKMDTQGNLIPGIPSKSPVKRRDLTSNQNKNTYQVPVSSKNRKRPH